MSPTRTKASGGGLASEPSVRYLQQVLEDLRRLELEIPRFQRPFVWKPEQRRELLRSVRDGIPMGSILVWQTAQTDLGTYPVRPPPHDLVQRRNSARHYVLDGVQRLTTLLGALYPTEAEGAADLIESEEGPDEDADAVKLDLAVRYNLKTESFVLANEEPTEGHHLPLELLYDLVALIKFQRALQGSSEKESEEWVARADTLARAFREYKVPIIPIVTEDLAIATRTFQRINSQGTTMSELHMLHALTWSQGNSLLARFAEGKEQYLAPLGWELLDDDVAVKACKAAVDVSIYEQKNRDEVSEKLVREPGTIERVFENLARVAQFLTAHCGIAGPSMLPYNMQATMLAEAFRANPKPDPTILGRLRAWFWATTYGELFSAISGSRLDKIMDAVRAIATRKIPEWPWPQPFVPHPLPRKANLRGARTIAFALRLAELEPRLSSCEKISDPQRVLAELRGKVLVGLLPRTLVSLDEFQSSENRIIALPDDLGLLRERILSHEDPGETLLTSHLIESGAYRALRSRRYREFLDLRRSAIEQLESAFIKPIREELNDGSQ